MLILGHKFIGIAMEVMFGCYHVKMAQLISYIKKLRKTEGGFIGVYYLSALGCH